MKSKIFALLSVSLFSLSAASLSVLSAGACEGEAHASDGASASKEPTLALSESGPQKAVFQVNGVMCKSCEKKIQAALSKVEGVKSVTFLKAGSRDGIRLAQVSFKKGSNVAPASLAEAVEGAGFKATLTQ